MEGTEFIAIVKSMEKDHPQWFDLLDSKASAESILETEQLLGHYLPEKYKWFLQNYGGGCFAFCVVYSLDKTGYSYLHERISNVVDFLPVSDNGCGDLFGFKVFNMQCGEEIYFFEHEEKKLTKTQYNDFFEFIIAQAFHK